MAILSPEMKSLFSEQLAMVATVGTDGRPNVAPKGTLRVLDDSTLVFAELAGETTFRNLQANPLVTVAVVDRPARKMVRCLGRAELLTSGEVFDAVAQQVRARGLPTPKAVVKVSIEDIRCMNV